MKRTLLLLLLFAAGLQAQTAAAPPATFVSVVRPFLEQNCQSCHNAKLQSGDVNFEVLKYATSVASNPTIWETAAYALRMDQMPPAGSPRLPKAEVDAVVAILDRDLEKLKQTSTA